MKTINEIAADVMHYDGINSIEKILNDWAIEIIKNAAEVAQDNHEDGVDSVYDAVYDYCTQLIA